VFVFVFKKYFKKIFVFKKYFKNIIFQNIILHSRLRVFGCVYFLFKKYLLFIASKLFFYDFRIF
jgi:hypothetical protein